MKPHLILVITMTLLFGACVDNAFPGIVAGNPDIDEDSYVEDIGNPEVYGAPEGPSGGGDTAPGDSDGGLPNGKEDDGNGAIPLDPNDPDTAPGPEEIPGGDRVQDGQPQPPRFIKSDAAAYDGGIAVPSEIAY